MPTITEKKPISKINELLDDPYVLILINDDSISFDHVIECLMKICGHSYEAANQCAVIVHFKGKCEVKRGSKEVIYDMRDKLSSCQLTVDVESSI